ncbi:hypothetical protein A4X13_0g8785 [Tilletia indica]|uniref:Uncharacterized protein n=1 Tax=Tilletia indica TaxID=43049 RepID=A0A177T1E7_9BASI|nr:hypothetical protein A4X13_0g8785 [Tilletia indica]
MVMREDLDDNFLTAAPGGCLQPLTTSLPSPSSLSISPSHSFPITSSSPSHSPVSIPPDFDVHPSSSLPLYDRSIDYHRQWSRNNFELWRLTDYLLRSLAWQDENRPTEALYQSFLYAAELHRQALLHHDSLRPYHLFIEHDELANYRAPLSPASHEPIFSTDDLVAAAKDCSQRQDLLETLEERVGIAQAAYWSLSGRGADQCQLREAQSLLDSHLQDLVSFLRAGGLHPCSTMANLSFTYPHPAIHHSPLPFCHSPASSAPPLASNSFTATSVPTSVLEWASPLPTQVATVHSSPRQSTTTTVKGNDSPNAAAKVHSASDRTSPCSDTAECAFEEESVSSPVRSTVLSDDGHGDRNGVEAQSCSFPAISDSASHIMTSLDAASLREGTPCPPVIAASLCASGTPANAGSACDESYCVDGPTCSDAADDVSASSSVPISVLHAALLASASPRSVPASISRVTLSDGSDAAVDVMAKAIARQVDGAMAIPAVTESLTITHAEDKSDAHCRSAADMSRWWRPRQMQETAASSGTRGVHGKHLRWLNMMDDEDGAVVVDQERSSRSHATTNTETDSSPMLDPNSKADSFGSSSKPILPRPISLDSALISLKRVRSAWITARKIVDQTRRTQLVDIALERLRAIITLPHTSSTPFSAPASYPVSRHKNPQPLAPAPRTFRTSNASTPAICENRSDLYPAVADPRLSASDVDAAPLPHLAPSPSALPRQYHPRPYSSLPPTPHPFWVWMPTFFLPTFTLSPSALLVA